jgi:hypothetical protein
MFLLLMNVFKKTMRNIKKFWKFLNLLILKNHLLLQFVENSWLNKFSMHLCPKIAFVSIKKNSNELLLGFMEKKNSYMFYQL